MTKSFENKYDFFQVPIFSMVFFLKSSAISFGRKLRPTHGSRYQQNYTKEVESRSTSSERTHQHVVKEINQTQEQSNLTNQRGNQNRSKYLTKVECSGEDVSNGDLVFNLPHPFVE